MFFLLNQNGGCLLQRRRHRVAYDGAVVQWLSLVGIIIPFYRNNPLSGILLLPYLGWQTFAVLLNGEICKRNPTAKGYNDAMLQAGISELQKQAAAYAGVE